MAKGQGQIIERTDSKWFLSVYEGTDTLTQRRVYNTSVVSGSREDAEAELAERVAATVLRPSGESTLEEYVEWWLRIAVRPRLRPKTTRDYQGHLQRYALPYLGKYSLNALRPRDVQLAISELEERALSPRTIRYTHSVLHAALEQGVKWELIDKNPASHTALPRKQCSSALSLTREQAAVFMTACEGNPFGCLFILALGSGLRPSECLALRVQDVDFSASKLKVERTVERHKGRWLFQNTKQPRSGRTVSLPIEVTARLEDYCRLHGKLAHPELLLFEAKHRTPIHERNLVQRIFKPLLKSANLPDIRLYDLRHSFATLSLSAGLPILWVSEHLGHASVAFTLEVYGHLLSEDRERTAARLGSLLFATPSKRQAIPAQAVTGLNRQEEQHVA